jgi:hypothetical protein
MKLQEILKQLVNQQTEKQTLQDFSMNEQNDMN